MPAVSVIIPCYNLGQYLDEAVTSVLAQTYQDFEVIVVDDGSTDGATQELLADYARPHTRVIRTAHAGLAAARNIGVANAAGRYLCALDADDRLLPSFLERTSAVLESDSSLTFCSSWLRTFGEEEWHWTPDRCDLPTLLWENTVLTAALVRRAAVVSIGGYDTAMPEQGDEDWDLWLRLVAAGGRGTILREVLFEYRRRAGSMSTICWYGAGHLPLLTYRVAKHRALYATHLRQVLLHQDEMTCALLRRNDELERHLASDLEPALLSRQQEQQALEARVAALDRPTAAAEASFTDAQHISALETALQAASAEAAALRSSRSWRLTAPLRRAYDVWLTLKGA